MRIRILLTAFIAAASLIASAVVLDGPTEAQTADDLDGSAVAVWRYVDVGFRLPTIEIRDAEYPDARGVQFAVDGEIDVRRTSARPDGYDKTGPRDDSTFHIYPKLELVQGMQLAASWSDTEGRAHSSTFVVGEANPTVIGGEFVNWYSSNPGPDKSPVIDIHESVYPSEEGVQFLIDGEIDDRFGKNGFDSTGPREGSKYRIWPRLDVVNGQRLEARWTDVDGGYHSSIFTAGLQRAVRNPPPGPTTTVPTIPVPTTTAGSSTTLPTPTTPTAPSTTAPSTTTPTTPSTTTPTAPSTTTPTAPSTTAPSTTTTTTQPPSTDIATWSDVDAGFGRQPTIEIDDEVYPDGTGVQFLVNGTVDDRSQSSRPNGYDATGPQEGSEYHIYPDITLDVGDVITARWIDRGGSEQSSDITVDGSVPPTPVTLPPSDPLPPPPSSESMPTMQSIIDNAGLSNPAILTKSGTITVTEAGSVIENMDVTGNIIIRADDVTIRNVRVTGSSSTAVIKPDRDVRGTTIENCEVNVGKANGAIGFLGYETTVRNCRITGFADGIKVETGGLYEGNYISMWKPAGDPKHLDGIQASSDRNYTIRHNVIEADKRLGNNSAVFVQAWNGQKNQNIYGIRVVENYVWGGNFTIYMEGGKDSDGSDPIQWISDAHMIGNVFTRPGTERYGLANIANCNTTTIMGNITSTGAVVDPCD